MIHVSYLMNLLEVFVHCQIVRDLETVKEASIIRSFLICVASSKENCILKMIIPMTKKKLKDLIKS